MSELDDHIRDVLRRVASDAPEPHPWSDVRRRAESAQAAPASSTRRTGVVLGAAACALALVVGLVMVGFDDRGVRVDEGPGSTTTDTTVETSPGPTTTDVTTTTTVPETGTADAGLGWSGGSLAEIDVGSLRPLAALDVGDVVVPTGPSGWRVQDAGWTDDDPATGTWILTVIEALPDNGFGQVLYVTLGSEPTCQVGAGCSATGESATVDGVVWELIGPADLPEDDPSYAPNTILQSRVGDRWIEVSAGAYQLVVGSLTADPKVAALVDGLRAGPPAAVAAVGEACWGCGAPGAEGDPFAAIVPSTDATGPHPSTTTTTTTTTTTSVTTPPPTTVDGPATGSPAADDDRPLTELRPGDVLIPTYLPPGSTLGDVASRRVEPDGTVEFFFVMESDGALPLGVRVWELGDGARPWVARRLDDPNHPPVEIAGLTWGWSNDEPARIAEVGRFQIAVYLHGIDRSEATTFIEGLRAVTPDRFPRPIAVDGDGLSAAEAGESRDAEIVAGDDRFELTAAMVGDQVCTKLEDTSIPPTAFFSANCWETTRFDGSGVVDFHPLDDTDTLHLVIGVIASPSVTTVRITSPDGDTDVVAAGPVNEVITGRFFLARLEFDMSGGVHLDDFEIEDASP